MYAGFQVVHAIVLSNFDTILNSKASVILTSSSSVPSPLPIESPGPYLFGDTEVDPCRYSVRIRGEKLQIPRRPFDLLVYLIQHRDRVVSHDELLRSVWKAEAMSPSTVPTCIAALRRFLRDNSAHPTLIKTVRGRGYQFTARVIDPNSRSSKSIGRSTELAVLSAALERAIHGGVELALVSGEAGIGKTHLLSTFLPRAQRMGARCIWGRCSETDGAPPLWPWAQILREISQHHPTPSGSPMEAIEALLAPDDATAVLSSTSTDPERFAFFSRVARRIDQFATNRPAVFLFDDLHLADLTSLLLLRFCLEETEASGLLIVAALRTSSMEPSSKAFQTIATLRSDPRSRSIQLAGISRHEVEIYLRDMRVQNARRISETLHDASAGNPFFLRELFRLVQASNWTQPNLSNLPKDVRDAALHHIHELPPSTHRILQLGAAIGRDFSPAVLSRICPLSPTELLRVLEPAIVLGVVEPAAVPSDSFRFKHLLLRDALYQQLDPCDRSRIHLKIARSLEGAAKRGYPTSPAELCHHYSAASGFAATSRACHYAIEAAAASERSTAFDDAVRYYRLALTLANELPSSISGGQATLKLRLGICTLRAGYRNEARALLLQAATAARETEDWTVFARAALSLAPGPFAIEVGVYDPQLVGLLQEALLHTQDDAVRAQLLARLSIALTWARAESRRVTMASEALVLAKRSRDLLAISLSLLARHSVAGGAENLAARVAIADQMSDLSQGHQEINVTFTCRLLRITSLLEAGNIPEVEAECGLYAKEARRIGVPHYLWYVDMFHAMLSRMRGDFAAAEKSAGRFQAIGEKVADQNAAQSFGAHRIIQLREQSRSGTALPIVLDLVHRFPSVTGWRSTLALIAAEAGQRELATLELERIDLSVVPRNEVWSATFVVLAQAAWELGHRTSASALYDALLPGEGRVAVLGFAAASLGSVSRYLGLLASIDEQWDRSIAHLEAAVQMERVLGAAAWEGHSLCDLADVLRRRNRSGDIDTARHLAACARTLAQKLRMRRLHERALAVLAPPGG